MKKVVTTIVSLVMCFVMLFALCACNQQGFLSKAQANRLYKTYGRPEAEMTIKYKKNSVNYEIRVVYSLLLDKTPIAVTNFINLVNSGAYDNSIVDSYKSSYHYVTMGKYKYEDDRYYNNTLAKEFVGEFESNGYREPDDGYSKFSILSLAMYHDESSDDRYFNTANGALILATSDSTLNANNYAVFAEMKSLTFVVTDDNGSRILAENVKRVPDDVRKHLESFSTASQTIYESKESETSHSISIISTVVSLTVKMVDADTDWSKLPKVG